MSGETSESNRPTKIFIVVGAIILALIIGFLIFGFKSEKVVETVEYNYFVFEEFEGLWHTGIEVDGRMYDAVFRFNPEQVEDVYVSGELGDFSAPIYISFDPESDSEQFKYLALASSELSLHLIRALNFSVEAACTKNLTDACVDRPIVSCDDVDKSVIVISSEPPTQITLKDNCVVLSGLELELLKSVDRLLFQWYKVMR